MSSELLAPIRTQKPQLGGPIQASCDFTYDDGSTLSVSYDAKTSLVNFDVSVAQNSFLGFGYGADMTDTSMVAWIANGPGI